MRGPSKNQAISFLSFQTALRFVDKKSTLRPNGRAQTENSHPNLRRLEQVSTLPSDVLIRGIGTTTLYHVLAILWYKMKHELLVNKIQLLP